MPDCEFLGVLSGRFPIRRPVYPKGGDSTLPNTPAGRLSFSALSQTTIAHPPLPYVVNKIRHLIPFSISPIIRPSHYGLFFFMTYSPAFALILWHSSSHTKTAFCSRDACVPRVIRQFGVIFYLTFLILHP